MTRWDWIYAAYGGGLATAAVVVGAIYAHPIGWVVVGIGIAGLLAVARDVRDQHHTDTLTAATHIRNNRHVPWCTPQPRTVQPPEPDGAAGTPGLQ